MNRACLWECVPSKDLTASSRNYGHRVRLDFSFFVFAVLSVAACCCVCITSSSKLCMYVAAAMVQRQPHFKCQGIAFVATTHGVLVRVRVSVFVCHPEHNLNNYNPCALASSENRVVHRHPNSNGTTSTEPHTGRIHTRYGVYEGTPVLPLFNLRHDSSIIPGFQVNYIPKRNLVYTSFSSASAHC